MGCLGILCHFFTQALCYVDSSYIEKEGGEPRNKGSLSQVWRIFQLGQTLVDEVALRTAWILVTRFTVGTVI